MNYPKWATRIEIAVAGLQRNSFDYSVAKGNRQGTLDYWRLKRELWELLQQARNK